MARRHLVQRISPAFNRRWLIGVLVLGALIAAGALALRVTRVVQPLELLALAADGAFQSTIHVTAARADTRARTPDAVARVPLVLGVRNPGTRTVTPDVLLLNLPGRFRLTRNDGRPLPATADPSSPLVRYRLDAPFEPVRPQRLPALLPAHDTIWLEITMPSYYCVAAGDSVPDFVVAPDPPVSTIQDLRIFYVFQGGDLETRHSGILDVGLDSTLFRRTPPPQPPLFSVESSVETANPDVGSTVYAGGRRVQCGVPGAPMEILSTTWTFSGGRLIALEYGGRVRKRLYDLDGDGVIDRESWDPDGDGVFDATRRARLPIPDFLQPVLPTPPDTIPGDSIPATDAFGRPIPDSLAPQGPGPGTPGQPAPQPTDPEPTDPEPQPEPEPEPEPEPSQPLGRPIPA